MVFISKEKLHVSAYSGHLQVLTVFCRKLLEPEDGRYRPKHVVFFLANKHHHLAIFYSCVFFTESTSPYSLALILLM